MEEADLLADEVAIVRKGELAALGSPLQLKADHGTALQFAVLVEKEDLDNTVEFIKQFFADDKDSVEVEITTAGNVDVKILKLQQDEDEQGVAVELLSEFVGWLDSEESKVTEYGFSNSSLEEVFLEVTKGDEEPEDENTVANNDDFTDEEGEAEVEAGNVGKVNDISSFQPNLDTMNQIRVLHADFWKRAWTGRGSIYQKLFFFILAIGALLLGMEVANSYNPTAWFILVLVFLSFLLTSTIGPIYADRNEGQFYLMQTQGLLPEAYLAGFGLYSFTVTTVYALLVLSLLFASPVFRDPDICVREINIGDDDYIYYDDCYRYGFGKAIIRPQTIYNYYDVYNGEEVVLQAYRSPGGYGYIVAIVLIYATSQIGGALSTAFFPGYKITLVLVTFASIAVCVWPIVEALVYTEEQRNACLENLTMESCRGDFFLNNTEDLVECVGRELNFDNFFGNYCMTPVSALLPQFGVYQGLVMAYQAKVTFISEPPNYVEDVLMPNLDGKCRGSSCVFPSASRLYWLNMVFMFIGAIILLIVGYSLAHLFVFPSGFFLNLRQSFDKLMNILCCRKEPKLKDDPIDEEGEFDVVTKELQEVAEMTGPFVDDPAEILDTNVVFHPEKIGERDSVPPVLMHKLRKVYPALGGRPPKVALHSLSMHVPKGQVLGLLGKNGAGKTTALKILSGAHEKSGGLGLVAGYDSDLEKIQVFERLGNCAQFDVVWGGRSVQVHLEFFAALKGLPKDQIAEAAKAAAVAVGLGSDEVYARGAGALSGGMRRRLSIAMSLLGSPAVVILDEPTTG
jgi:ABC-type multidrug transport system ATPase subunit